MSFMSGNFRQGAMALGLMVAAAGVFTAPAQAQNVIFGWGPSVSYGYVPPAPIYSYSAPRYAPAPVYRDDFYEDVPRARRLNPAEVRAMLNARGLRVTRPPFRNGAVYVADIRDRAGNERRVIVDGYYGRVLQSFPAQALREPARPGPRVAGRPAIPDVDTDMRQPSRPTVIPGVGASRPSTPGLQKPRETDQQRKPAKSLAAKPPAAAPSAIPAPSTATPSVGTPTPPLTGTSPDSPPAATVPSAAALPAEPAPAVILAPASPPAPTVIPTPEIVTAPPAAEPQSPAGAAPAPQAVREAEPPAERPRRKVRFIKPDSPTVANPNVPGGQIIPAPELPAPVALPRSAEASPASASPSSSGATPSVGSSVLE
jgi:hypothetical protein